MPDKGMDDTQAYLKGKNTLFVFKIIFRTTYHPWFNGNQNIEQQKQKTKTKQKTTTTKTQTNKKPLRTF